jgi:hypothetical protein
MSLNLESSYRQPRAPRAPTHVKKARQETPRPTTPQPKILDKDMSWADVLDETTDKGKGKEHYHRPTPKPACFNKYHDRYMEVVHSFTQIRLAGLSVPVPPYFDARLANKSTGELSAEIVGILNVVPFHAYKDYGKICFRDSVVPFVPRPNEILVNILTTIGKYLALYQPRIFHVWKGNFPAAYKCCDLLTREIAGLVPAPLVTTTVSVEIIQETSLDISRLAQDETYVPVKLNNCSSHKEMTKMLKVLPQMSPVNRLATITHILGLHGLEEGTARLNQYARQDQIAEAIREKSVGDWIMLERSAGRDCNMLHLCRIILTDMDDIMSIKYLTDGLQTCSDDVNSSMYCALITLSDTYQSISASMVQITKNLGQ